MKFFSPPFDFDNIDRILRDDFSRFSGAAYVKMGVAGAWESALDNFVEITAAYKAAGRSEEHLLELFDLLVDHCQGRPEYFGRLQAMAAKLNFYLPARLGQIVSDAKLDPATRKSKQDKEWLAEHQAKLDRERAERETAARRR